MSWFLKTLSAALIAFIFLALPVYAQENPETGILIHVVQRGETLFSITQQYGTTIEALSRSNSLADPNALQVGQRLIIPAERLQLVGVVATHIVEPGETLHTIAARYNSTPQSLSQVNFIANAASLYVGQNILVTLGANGNPPPEKISRHIVQSGETLWWLSATYQIPILQLAAMNGLDIAAPLQVGQSILLSGSESAGRLVDLPSLIGDIQIAPLPAEQGRSIGVMIRAPQGATVSGAIFDKEVRFISLEGSYRALIGVHSFIEAGIYPFVVTVTDEGGNSATYESRIRVIDGGYGRESIDIPPDRQDLLDPAVVQAELDRITAIMSGFIEQKYFNGLMSLPSTGPVTSQYGTRRSYNGSGFNTFHGGADFGGAPGSLILAPAEGIVVLAEALNVRGNTVILDHGWGVYTGYWHQTEIFVQAGQFVQRGDPIGTIGATGLVTGAHLHWEMWVGGVQVDPLQWVSHNFDTFKLVAG